jgi:hypothetical protein
MLESSTDVLTYLGDFISEVLGKFAVDASANIGLEKEMSVEGILCIVTPSIGASLSLNFAVVGELLQAIAASFIPISISIAAAIETIQAVLCIPRALIATLLGGECGPDLPDISAICPEAITTAIETLEKLLDAMDNMLTSLLSAIRLMSLNLSIAVEFQAGVESSLGECNPPAVTALAALGNRLLEEA